VSGVYVVVRNFVICVKRLDQNWWAYICYKVSDSSSREGRSQLICFSIVNPETSRLTCINRAFPSCEVAKV